MAKPNKDGWVRHHGCIPKDVKDGDTVLVRYRNGDVVELATATHFMWPDNTIWRHYGKDHILCDYDIMAYKLLEGPPPPYKLG